MIWSFLHMSIGHLYVIFAETSIQVVYQFLMGASVGIEL